MTSTITNKTMRISGTCVVHALSKGTRFTYLIRVKQGEFMGNRIYPSIGSALRAGANYANKICLANKCVSQ